MSDWREKTKKPETDEFDRAAGRAEQGFDQARVEAESERLQAYYESHKDQPPGPQDHLDRLDRIEDSSSMRFMPDFDPEREAALQDRSIDANPRAEIRRTEGGLDRETEWKLGKSLSEQERKELEEGK